MPMHLTSTATLVAALSTLALVPAAAQAQHEGHAMATDSMRAALNTLAELGRCGAMAPDKVAKAIGGLDVDPAKLDPAAL